MPLTMVSAGEEARVKKVGGKAEVRQHLENLGFVAGCPVRVVSKLGGNVIVCIKEARVAISRELANKIII